MTDQNRPPVGTIGWTDLTVQDAARIRDFYAGVVGWESSPVDMGGYEDFNVMPPGSATPVAGVCHARGGNADLPAQWLIYIIVEDVKRSAARCLEMGGQVIAGPRDMAGGGFCVIRDPAGAVCALYQPPA
ncbi:MAG: VOC family protein [Candidatus Polarisedimenticolia bacterium]